MNLEKELVKLRNATYRLKEINHRLDMMHEWFDDRCLQLPSQVPHWELKAAMSSLEDIAGQIESEIERLDRIKREGVNDES
mgnify:CR=1 FL=1